MEVISFFSRSPSPKWPYPKGPRVLGPKYYNINGIWDLKPYYLDPWTVSIINGEQDFYHAPWALV